MFACSWGGNQFSPLLLLYVHEQHFSEVAVTVLLGVYVLGLIPALLLAGSLSDRHGRRPVVIVGVIAALIGSGLLALGGLGFGWLMAGRLLSGVTVGVAMSAGISWMKELSQAPHDPGADAASGARRGSLAFTLGSAAGALVAGVLAQWGPIPTVLPFAIHLVVAVPFVVLVTRLPETALGAVGAARAGQADAGADARGAVGVGATDTTGVGSDVRGVGGPWWAQLRIPAASHKRFVRVVAVAAPWIFAAAAMGYGYLPTRLADQTAPFGIAYATAATVIALGASSLIQPVARRVHSLESARGLGVGTLGIAAGLVLVTIAIVIGSPVLGLVANAVLGCGFGISLVSGLLEVQRIAGARDLAGLTGVFYALAYAGFLLPTAISALALVIPAIDLLVAVVALAALAIVVVRLSSRRHLPEG
ncbi:MFS transporter [Schumannella soli]|uniref:MFS transporter n=1 Tax=Schumannella soli TaxID=2590779 RepID=A0A506Y825_9MICO|nr:MFS transporter [Schumannella soli]TPW78033.1 MFS transporter [Schumannella soli]